MGNSSSSSTRKISAQDRAILDLKTQRDKLHQYQKRLTALTAHEHDVARQLLRTGDKARALLALRRKKWQETLLGRADAQLAQLEQLAAEVEFARIQQAVVFGLQQGTAALREIQREMGGVAGVERLMGENADALAYQKEISDMLTNRLSVQEEEEVEDELAALEAAMSPINITTATSQLQLPTTPNHIVVAEDEDTLPAVPATATTEQQKERRSSGGKQAAEPLLA